MEEALLNYGLPGIVIGGMSIFIMYKEKTHRDERNEWRAQASKQFDRIIEVSEKTNEAHNRNTAVLNELKGIIKTIKK